MHSSSSTKIIWWLVLLSISITFIPLLILFLHSIDAGFYIVDRMYPQLQSRTGFIIYSKFIYSHMYLNGVALFTGIFQFNQFVRKKSELLHRIVGFVYMLTVTLGSIAAIMYARNQSYGGEQEDGGSAGVLSFIWMAIGSVLPGYAGFYYIVFRNDITRHKEWMLRSYACLFGSGVLFRVLANVYLPYMPKQYPAWIAMIWMSWVIPLLCIEQFISYNKSKQSSVWNKLSNQQKQKLLKLVEYSDGTDKHVHMD
jgi:uncharacterized membrane protein